MQTNVSDGLNSCSLLHGAMKYICKWGSVIGWALARTDRNSHCNMPHRSMYLM